MSKNWAPVEEPPEVPHEPQMWTRWMKKHAESVYGVKWVDVAAEMTNKRLKIKKGHRRAWVTATVQKEFQEKYPMVEKEPEPPPPEPEPVYVDLPVRDKPDLARDIMWVYASLDRDVTPEDCPGAGAWGLRVWALKNRDAFYKTHVPKAVGVLEKDHGAGEEEDGDPGLGSLEDFMKEFGN